MFQLPGGVMAGLVQAISINMAPSCQINRDVRVKPAHDGL
jgi:hypothetical protein